MGAVERTVIAQAEQQDEVEFVVALTRPAAPGSG